MSCVSTWYGVTVNVWSVSRWPCKVDGTEKIQELTHLFPIDIFFFSGLNDCSVYSCQIQTWVRLVANGIHHCPFKQWCQYGNGYLMVSRLLMEMAVASGRWESGWLYKKRLGFRMPLAVWMLDGEILNSIRAPIPLCLAFSSNLPSVMVGQWWVVVVGVGGRGWEETSLVRGRKWLLWGRSVDGEFGKKRLF